ncbi:MAG: hypothetical protein U5K29_01375 [Acidimicrobiales bacterium]|nr:hypothetical protein [Acidimicrobiales bacterium]
MIVVVEGPSAAGKTTWCVAQGPDSVVAETERIEPPAASSDDGLARFWNDVNCRRWAEALRVETERDLAVCDTDPLKLHYDYCLARLGVISWERFEAGIDAATEAIASCRLGIADLVLVNISDDETLSRRRDADPTRSRRNFDLHRRLGSGLRDWYQTLARLDQDRVRWEYPSEMPPMLVRDRYDTDLFRVWMSQLPREAAGP